MDDVNILAGHINALNTKTEKMAKALEQHSAHLSSFISLTDSRIKNLIRGIKDNSNFMLKMTTAFHNKFFELDHSFANLSEILITQVNKATTLMSKLDKLENPIQSLLEGNISPFLISKHMFGRVLAEINHNLRKSYQKFYLVHTDPSYYYSNGQFLFARNKNELYITFKFPISSQSTPLQLYKVLSLPVPTSENVTEKMQATQLLSLSSYFAITSHHDYFVSLSTEDLSNCVQGSVRMCNFNVPLNPITIPDCTMALFANNIKQVKELCNFRYIPTLLSSDIIELTATQVLLYNTPTVILDCPEEKKVLKGCAFCVIQIPCRCSLSTESLYYAPRLVDCNQSADNFSVIHPVNLA